MTKGQLQDVSSQINEDDKTNSAFSGIRCLFLLFGKVSAQQTLLEPKLAWLYTLRRGHLIVLMQQEYF